jgi:hypothetical protein
MTPLVIILGPTGAGRADVVKELVAHAWPEGRKVRVLREVREGGVAPDAWEFKDGHAVVPAPGDEEGAAVLVTHGSLHVIDQMEALHRAVRPMQPDAVWRVARILTVVDCPLTMKHKAVEEWYRPCVHFSDAVIINRRWEVPGQWVSKFLEPYEKEFYPCLFFNLTKIGAINNPPAVIDGEPLRLSHIFDDIDAVDEMEFDEDNLPDEPFDLVRQVDKYFERDELGRRRIVTPEIADVLRHEGRA